MIEYLSNIDGLKLLDVTRDTNIIILVVLIAVMVLCAGVLIYEFVKAKFDVSESLVALAICMPILISASVITGNYLYDRPYVYKVEYDESKIDFDEISAEYEIVDIDTSNHILILKIEKERKDDT